ncbi:MAG: class I SAM-dependent methyltransferase [Deltaproteobacteria bacterium]|nr:class I SAM-dependent methyltransferase [Deltaproteobacteria bacterium]
MARALPALFLSLSLLACGGAPPPGASPALPPAPAGPAPSSDLRAVIDAPDRSAADRELDAGRKPAELLAFAGIKPGMKVAELAAGGGYTTELIARAVGPSGVVYAQNNAWIMDRFAKKPLEERLAKPVNKNVVEVVREFDDPLPPEAKDLDVVIDVLFYHDLFWMNDGHVDRKKMNAALLRALKPGGVYVVVDHSGRLGTAATEVSTLHRIEEKVVLEEITGAGFKLDRSGDFLKNPNDTRDWNASPMKAAERRGTSDRFALRFLKP